MHDQTEEALKRHLGKVPAPPELWNRVQGASPRSAKPGFPILSAATAFAAVIVMAVVGWSMLRNGPRQIEIQSADANEVRQWVLANSGMNVPLAEKPSSLVEILGASIDRAGDLVAIISYRVGELRATLFVRKAVSGDTPHKGTEIASSWTMGGQTFTLALAGPGEVRMACLLCHSSPVAALY